MHCFVRRSLRPALSGFRPSVAYRSILRSAAPLIAIGVLAPLAACGSTRSGDGAKGGSDVGLPPASTTEAPSTFRVRFETSKGAFVVEAHRAWAPRGVDRLYQLVQSSFFDNTRFFRVVTGFMVQFGVHGDPGVNAAWDKLAIPDDSVTQSNTRGMMSFATAGPASRTTQVFINLVDNHSLDEMGFAPVAQVIEGMAVIDSLYAGYGDASPSGFGPEQARIMAEGNSYLEKEFPKLDFIRTARLVEATPATSVSGDSATGAAKGAATPPTSADTAKGAASRAAEPAKSGQVVPPGGAR
jgi:peptidyl-prolyl cis-trans isomerase A (cyclophilin A)